VLEIWGLGSAESRERQRDKKPGRGIGFCCFVSPSSGIITHQSNHNHFHPFLQKVLSPKRIYFKTMSNHQKKTEDTPSGDSGRNRRPNQVKNPIHSKEGAQKNNATGSHKKGPNNHKNHADDERKESLGESKFSFLTVFQLIYILIQIWSL
jgi:hypothetical protein